MGDREEDQCEKEAKAAEDARIDKLLEERPSGEELINEILLLLSTQRARLKSMQAMLLVSVGRRWVTRVGEELAEARRCERCLERHAAPRSRAAVLAATHSHVRRRVPPRQPCSGGALQRLDKLRAKYAAYESRFAWPDADA